MARLTPIERLQSDIGKILEEYTEDVERTSEECVKKVAQKGAKALRNSSPVRSGKYASGWTSRVETSRTESVGIIYNKARPGLAHLLEHGHVSRNGTGRTFGRVPEHVHIAPIEEEIAQEFERLIKVELT